MDRLESLPRIARIGLLAAVVVVGCGCVAAGLYSLLPDGSLHSNPSLSPADAPNAPTQPGMQQGGALDASTPTRTPRLTPADATLPTHSSVPIDTLLPTEFAGPHSGKYGDTVEEGGYFLRVLAVEDPARPEWDPWYYPERGTKLVAVEIVVGCVSCEGVGVHPLLAVLVDADGGAYMAELGALERHRQLVPMTIGPREYARGRVAFEIPDSAVKAKLKYRFPDVTLQVGLAR